MLQRLGMLHLEVALGSTAGPTRMELCGSGESQPDQATFGVGCPGADSEGSTVEPGAVAPGTCCLKHTRLEMAPGSYGMGGNVTASAGVEASAYAAWIEYPESPSAFAPLTEAPPVPALPAPWVEIRPRGVVDRSGRLALRLRCVAERACTARVSAAGASRRVTVAAGDDRKVTLRVARRSWARLRARRVTRLRVVMAGTDGAGRSRRSVGSVRVTRR